MKTCSDVPKGCIVDNKVKKECFFKRRSDMSKLEKESGNTNILRGGSKSVPLKMFENAIFFTNFQNFGKSSAILKDKSILD